MGARSITAVAILANRRGDTLALALATVVLRGDVDGSRGVVRSDPLPGFFHERRRKGIS